MDKKILIIDDEPNILRSLKMILSSEGYTVFMAPNLKEAKTIIEEEEIFLYLVDVFLPDGDGIEFIKQIRQKRPSAIIIMISGHASIKMAVDATRRGADDFLEKPLSKDKLLVTLHNFLKRLQIQQKYDDLQRKTHQDELIGASSTIEMIYDQINKVAATDSKVLISGESGTGKEIIAHLIHSHSNRKTGPYVKINCAAIPEDLIEAELFGVEKGAYTGAIERREGKFKLADGGTLFLDEIADMSLKTQTKVLRILQEGEFERLGSNDILKTDVRIIAATNKDLKSMVNNGTYREDLYFRLNVLPILVPALRERKEDIPLLIDHFLNIYSHENNRQNIQITEKALARLTSYSWPGNVRELKNLIERMVIMSDGKFIDIEDLPENFFYSEDNIDEAFQKKQSLRVVRDKIESRYVQLCLEKFDGNITKTAKFLKVDRTYLYKKLQKLGIEK